MSSPEQPRHSHGESHEPQDALEGIIHAVPIVLPIVGAVLIFLLAWIAVYLA